MPHPTEPLGEMEPEWYELAACRGRGWFGFFDAPDTTSAQKTCIGCEVRQTCLIFAMDEGISYGVWGGLTPEQRRRASYSRPAA